MPCMQEEHELARALVKSDFFPPDGLSEETAPPAPEKYVIERRLGQGEAVRFIWRGNKSLDRRVALKYLSHARPAEVERFFR